MGYEQLEKSQSRISMFEFGDFFLETDVPGINGHSFFE